MKLRVLFFALMVLSLAACEDNSGNDRRYADESTLAEPPEQHKSWKIKDESKIKWQESGLGIYIIEEGPGNFPPVGENVQVNYEGRLASGKKFDSSWDRGQPFSFNLGSGQVIKGWDEGISKLPQGSKAILVIPPALGYGEQGAGANIPRILPCILMLRFWDNSRG